MRYRTRGASDTASPTQPPFSESDDSDYTNNSMSYTPESNTSYTDSMLGDKQDYADDEAYFGETDTGSKTSTHISVGSNPSTSYAVHTHLR